MQRAIGGANEPLEKRPEKVLVVDDDYGFLDMIAFTLRQMGYSVTTASNGVDALTMVAAERPDLMILDVMMPGVDGYEVLRQIESSPDISVRVIVVSAAPDVDICRWSVSAYLAKPFMSSQLVWLVERVLSNEPGRDQAEPRAVAA